MKKLIYILTLIVAIALSSCVNTKKEPVNYLPESALIAVAEQSNGRFDTCYLFEDFTMFQDTVDVDYSPPGYFISKQYDSLVYPNQRFYYEGGSGIVRLHWRINPPNVPCNLSDSAGITDNYGRKWVIVHTGNL
jgi:hypothetical protein